MNRVKIIVVLCLALGLMKQNFGQEKNGNSDGTVGLYQDVTKSNLPFSDLQELSMDAGVADLVGDGDLDILIAIEHKPNIFLVNDGKGKFSNESSTRIPQMAHDSEDIGIADFDLDGDLDIIVVSEDDKINELYLNNGDGTFGDSGSRIPVTGTSNSVVVYDLNMDGAADILIGNNGQNNVLMNNGKGYFKDETKERLGTFIDVTQDLTLADVDGDGDQDLLIGNEDNNRLLINDGNGFFKDESSTRIPYRTLPEETREVDVADIDGDGDLDILYGNVQAFVEGAERQNRLLLNDGKGFFTDITETHLPKDNNRCFGVAFLDIDNDGDADIVTGNTNGPRFNGSTPFSVYLNEGNGTYYEDVDGLLPKEIEGRGFDIDFEDFNGDGVKDLFLSNRGSQDFLLFGVPE